MTAEFHTASRCLSESESKTLLSRWGIPFVPEHLASTAQQAGEAAVSLACPCAVKLNGDNIAHKTERGLVRLNVDPLEVERVASELLNAARPDDGEVGVLVAPMLRSTRELIVGLVRDPSFGPVLMVGIGGVTAEVIRDVTFRLCPIDEGEARSMVEDLAGAALFGPFRGEPRLDLSAFAALLVGLSAMALEYEGWHSVDINPVLIVDGKPVAVDALVELS